MYKLSMEWFNLIWIGLTICGSEMDIVALHYYPSLMDDSEPLMHKILLAQSMQSLLDTVKFSLYIKLPVSVSYPF